jgi:ribonuclease T2
MPAFVVWPVNATQVQIAVNFAVKHNLCIMVAGTGHDFLNRHSCKDGFFIRTSLLKSVSWDLTDSKGFGNPDGNVKFGAGFVFSEA